jgi:photosystem II stability/assembly factor-like uncharacterized protein
VPLPFAFHAAKAVDFSALTARLKPCPSERSAIAGLAERLRGAVLRGGVLFSALLLCAVLFAASALAQWQPQQSHTTANLRGLSVVNERVVWASGTGGTFLRTTDGGMTWQPGVIAGAEQLDFRDVEAIDQNTALLLAAGPGDRSRIYKTADAGKNWRLLYTNPDAKGFLDCMAFWDKRRGIVVGDPVDGSFVVLLTDDAGEHWRRVAKEKLPPALPGEGAFAASGTCVAVQGKKSAWFGTANAARVFRSNDGGESWSVATTPMASGSESKGIFSLVFWNEKRGVAVGGDYKNPEAKEGTAAVTGDGGESWKLANAPSYRSGISMRREQKRASIVLDSMTVGSAAVEGNYNAVACVGRICWAVGPKGVIAVTR